MKITKKDILYLKWLVLFIAIYGFWTFILSPLNNNLSAKQVSMQVLKLDTAMAEQTLPTKDVVKAQEIEKIALTEEIFSKFFDFLTPAQTESVLIPILYQHNSKINYFQVKQASVVTPETTLKLNEQLTYKVKELVDLYNHMSVTDKTLPVTESQLLKTQITYILSLSFDDYRALIHSIDRMEVSILLSSSNYDFEDKTAELVFDIYSIEKIDFAQ